MRTIFVEGIDDSNFIKTLLGNDKNVKIIEYAKERKEKINGIINTINILNENYIMLADLDEKDEKNRKKELKKKFKSLSIENIFFSIQEIESWYLAGISDNCIKKYKVKSKMINDTGNITKEKFEKIFKNNRETISVIKYNLLSEYDIEKAKSRNSSLRIFLENAV